MSRSRFSFSHGADGGRDAVLSSPSRGERFRYPANHGDRLVKAAHTGPLHRSGSDRPRRSNRNASKGWSLVQILLKGFPAMLANSFIGIMLKTAEQTSGSDRLADRAGRSLAHARRLRGQRCRRHNSQITLWCGAEQQLHMVSGGEGTERGDGHDGCHIVPVRPHPYSLRQSAGVTDLPVGLAEGLHTGRTARGLCGRWASLANSGTSACHHRTAPTKGDDTSAAVTDGEHNAIAEAVALPAMVSGDQASPARSAAFPARIADQ